MKTSFVKAASFSFFLMAIFALTTSFEWTNPASRWEKLGERRVNRGLDHDVIMVTASEGNFKAIKLVVRHSGINLHRCVVHFANGGDQEVEIRQNIPSGGESRVIDLNGRDRYINHVSFWYDTKGGVLNDKAVVELWGRH